MNYAHAHLVLNHVPVILFPAGVLLFAYAVLSKDDKLKRVSFAVFVLVALAAIAVYLTGNEAEELIEDLPGVADRTPVWLIGRLTRTRIRPLSIPAKPNSQPLAGCPKAEKG
ncbi:MAG: hypothetical protein Q7T82_15210 [Armatimonadota bacterium]|nr:hypothetical protein [Armatimonadota bacterium]